MTYMLALIALVYLGWLWRLQRKQPPMAPPDWGWRNRYKVTRLRDKRKKLPCDHLP